MVIEAQNSRAAAVRGVMGSGVHVDFRRWRKAGWDDEATENTKSLWQAMRFDDYLHALAGGSWRVLT